MFSLKQSKLSDFPKIYKIMQEAFPKAEIRTFDSAFELLKKEDYAIFSAYSDCGEIDGFIACWNFENFCFVEHFAVSQKNRGKGIGTKMIIEFLKAKDKKVFIEVEEPANEIAIRRIDFYERCGFKLSDFGYIQPNLQEDNAEIPLKIMSYPDKITNSEFEDFKSKVFEKVYCEF